MDFLRKLTSRKFLAALLGVASGLAMLFGLDEGVVTAVAGAVTALGSVVAYIASEGRIDAAAVAKAAGAAEKAREELQA
jgi:phage shock protein PspC (stress-responsive transcriptional regulator)